MLFVILNIAVLGVLTLVCEYLWRSKKIVAETARKTMHILGGVLSAFWPLYLSWGEIQLLIVLSVIAIVVLRGTGLMQSFFAVKRKTVGDILGPLTIGVLAFFSPPTVLFVLAVLHIALADGLAAVVGTRLGKTNSYTILGYKKSIAGTTTCLIVSLLIVLGVYTLGGFSLEVSPLALLVIPVTVALVENIGVFGVDNTLIAVTVGVLGKMFNFY